MTAEAISDTGMPPVDTAAIGRTGELRETRPSRVAMWPAVAAEIKQRVADAANDPDHPWRRWPTAREMARELG